ncbi:MAG: PEGA domain-containing protein, partial [Acidobacteria bacterium]
AVDGKYVGSTPSTLKLAAGDHTISVEKPGFKSWRRTVTLASGSEITLDATLEKAQ